MNAHKPQWSTNEHRGDGRCVIMPRLQASDSVMAAVFLMHCSVVAMCLFWNERNTESQSDNVKRTKWPTIDRDQLGMVRKFVRFDEMVAHFGYPASVMITGNSVQLGRIIIWMQSNSKTSIPAREMHVLAEKVISFVFQSTQRKEILLWKEPSGL